MANIGYVRISTKDKNQSLALQLDAMKAAGIEKIFSDEGVSGSLASRKGLDEALAYLRENTDTLVVWKLDRLGRNTKNVLTLLDELASNGIGFRSLTEGLDTTGNNLMNRLLITLLAAFAEMERSNLIERTNAGLSSARARGKVGGRPAKLSTRQHKMIRGLYEAKTLTISAIASEMGVSEQTVYRSLRSTREIPAVELQPVPVAE